MVAGAQFWLPPEIYLELETESEQKHEYIDGYAYAMTGALDAHVTVALNLASILRNHIRGSVCRIYISDMKVKIESLNRYYYPDLIVTCDPRDRQTHQFKQYPCLIVEVLCNSTQGFDRGDKFADYQELESLQEYLLINPNKQRMECFRRQANGIGNGIWLLQNYTEANRDFQLESLDFEGAIADIYEVVIFEPNPITQQITAETEAGFFF